MKHERLSRRDLFLKCAALGSLAVVPQIPLAHAFTLWEEQRLKPTGWDEIGPFYKREAPHNALLRAPGDPGLPVSISGKVLDVSGNLLPGATVEVWQTNHQGYYDLDGYRYRATLIADDHASYSFDSVMPGHYPGRVCQHVHYLVNAPGHKTLTTQLYFATDPVFEGDPDHNYTRDPLIYTRDLVRPVTLAGDPKEIQARVNFEIVLERL